MASADFGIAAAEWCTETTSRVGASFGASVGAVDGAGGRLSHSSTALRDGSKSVSTSPPFRPGDCATTCVAE